MSEDGDHSEGGSETSQAEINARLLSAISILIQSFHFVLIPDVQYGFILRPATEEDGDHFVQLLPYWFDDA